MAENKSNRKHKDPKTGRFIPIHGFAHEPEYYVWLAIKNRCGNPKHTQYKWYGGRGITVCKRWRLVKNFFADMGRRPSSEYTIERKDNDGPYCKQNCIWATREEQGRNKRNNHFATYAGETKTLSEWARLFKMNRRSLALRLERHWSIEKALHTPMRQLGHSCKK